MNIYTIEEREGQAALELVKALEAKHGWQGVGVAITEDKDAKPVEGHRNITVTVTPPEGKPQTYSHAYPIDDEAAWQTDVLAQINGEGRGKTAKEQSQAVATPPTPKPAASQPAANKPTVIKLDAPEPAGGDTPKLAEQPKAKAPTAPAKRHAGRKTTPKGKRS